MKDSIGNDLNVGDEIFIKQPNRPSFFIGKVVLVNEEMSPVIQFEAMGREAFIRANSVVKIQEPIAD